MARKQLNINFKQSFLKIVDNEVLLKDNDVLLKDNDVLLKEIRVRPALH